VFGATIALALARAGHAVSVFERLDAPLKGASYNNQNRLHLGFHYPRDVETARQCIQGFAAFKAAFAECIVEGFPNAYFVAAEGSLTPPAAYLAFCDALGLRHTAVDPARFVPPVRDVALGVLTDEAVYDSARLGSVLARRMAEAGLAVSYGAEAQGLVPRESQLLLSFADGRTEAFDAVVNATYANISRLGESLGLPVPDRQYEYTAVPIVEAPFARAGVTVMDGPFMTVLPFGAGPHHLLYHVEHTVVARAIGRHMDPAWLDPARSPFARLDAQALFRRMRDAAARFVPVLADARLAGFLHGPRMVLARRDDTDARPSIIEQPRPNYVSVFSGKIDHCLWVAEDVARRLRA
jgi:glycine/D-amino acid oxidase-like deaminating enzyme